jgi:hypothetical protein
MKSDTAGEGTGAAGIRSCFLFAVLNASEAQRNFKKFRDPVALEVSRELAHRLSADGFTVTVPKPGKACDAAFKIRVQDFNVLAIVLAKRSGTHVEFSVLTSCIRPLWRPVTPQVILEGWVRACEAIEKGLRQDRNITSLQWLTEDQADAYSEEAGSGVKQSPATVGGRKGSE